MTEHPRKPIGFALETDDEQQASIKASSGRARASIEFAPDIIQPPAVIPPMATLPPARKFRWGTILFSAIGALIVFGPALASRSSSKISLRVRRHSAGLPAAWRVWRPLRR